MFYWAPNSIASAARMYYESRREQAGPLRVDAPVGVALFPKELSRPPRSWCEPRYNIQRWTSFAKGGHFAALERPHDLLEDVRTFFRPLR